MASAQSSKIARRQRQSSRNRNRLCLNLGENVDSYRCGVYLHDDLVEMIFTYLPIKECVQIGLVAKKYRRTWRKCRNLTFGREFGATRMWYIHVVSRVFDLHVGKKIETLRLHFDPSGVEHLLDQWVRTSIEKGVEELDLDIYQGTVPFGLPTKADDEATLKVLTLNYSVLQMPYNMKSLSSLTTVILRQVDLTARIVEALFESCVHLETFDMADCYGVRNLRVKANEHKRFRVLKVGGCPEISSVEIDAPRLRCLYYSGVLVSRFQICEPLLLLDEAILNFRPSRGLTSPWLVEKLVADISRVTILTITSTFLEVV